MTSRASSFSLKTIYSYRPPDWAARLNKCPQHRLKVQARVQVQLPFTVATLLQIAQIPTPIHKWSLPGVSEGFDVYIKRDDLTGAALSGNKVLCSMLGALN